VKILYVASGRGEDYQRDVLFHGLRTALGADAVDVNRIASLYEQPEHIKSDMYGRGYTLYGTLPDIEVDREDISAKLRRRYFDLVIYGSIHRCTTYLEDVRRQYPVTHIAYVDGEDTTAINWTLLGRGIYFKRELQHPILPVLSPIHFAVPSVKFISDTDFEDNLNRKTRAVAPCDPRDRSTYVFQTEGAYYQQYRESFFGVTTRKAGWDCMRHHEIVSQGTAPLFMGLEACPIWTIHRLPREQLLQLRELYERDPEMASPATRASYAGLMREVFSYYKRTFTTEALAEYVLGVISDLGVLTPSRRRPWALQARWLLDKYGRAVASTLSG
jgi:hypothetical protein